VLFEKKYTVPDVSTVKESGDPMPMLPVHHKSISPVLGLRRRISSKRSFATRRSPALISARSEDATDNSISVHFAMCAIEHLLF
jgi:hypothetical protein